MRRKIGYEVSIASAEAPWRYMVLVVYDDGFKKQLCESKEGFATKEAAIAAAWKMVYGHHW